MYVRIVSVVAFTLASATAAFGASISDAKLLADNSSVSLSAKVVTYASTDPDTSTSFFYIEEDSRNVGIRVAKAAHGLSVGMRVDVAGTMKTGANRERYILATSAVQTAAPNANGTVTPVGLSNSALGGTDWQVVGTGGQKSTSNSIGLNNIGLLVRTWGHFQQVDTTTFTVDDGSGLFVKCTVLPGTFLYSGWQSVSVTGVSSMYEFNNSIYPPNVLVRDIQVSLPVESVSVSCAPTGNTSPVVNVSETYSTTGGSTCNQGHTVEYSFNWGDGASSPWSTSTNASHAWSALGAQTVTVTARCQVHTSVSAISAGLQVDVTDSVYRGEMIYIPAGSFLMGNNGSEPYSFCSELPQHSVNLSGYYIGKCDVTRGEYRQFINAGGYSNSAYWSSAGWSWNVSSSRTQPSYWDAVQDWGTGSFTQTDAHPVVGVSYYESEAFCSWAGGHLPTEAQWEKAARWTGSHANVYPWGDTWDYEKCNSFYDHNAAGGGYQKYQTSPVGSYPTGASPYGCQDMAGNVWQWCQDWYVSYPGSICPFDYTNSYRVMRGGGWPTSDYHGRCAYRASPNPSVGGNYYGFRLVR